tara:strand:+ start:12801 stop:13286 length:486 start_codon:yes stop_codon:yes gene_type:complete
MRKFLLMLLVSCHVASFQIVVAYAAGYESAEDALQSYKKAVHLIDQRKFSGAISLLKESLNVDIEDRAQKAGVFNMLGYSYRKTGRFKSALGYYKQALKLKPDHRGAHEYIGEAYLALKNPELAKYHLDRLQIICGTLCEEYKDLKEAYDAYTAGTRLGGR